VQLANDMLVYGGITPVSCSGETTPSALSALLLLNLFYQATSVSLTSRRVILFSSSASPLLPLFTSISLHPALAGEWSFPSASGTGPGLRYYHRAVYACFCRRHQRFMHRRRSHPALPSAVSRTPSSTCLVAAVKAAALPTTFSSCRLKP
jgi:hypothetical protein